MIVDELVTILGFKLDPKVQQTAARFNTQLEEVSQLAVAAGASLMAAAASVLYFAEKSAGAGAEIERFHQLTGMSTDSIQKWTYAAQQISGNKESILRDIESITTSLNPLMPGQFNQGLFQLFGERMNTFKDANEALLETAKMFQGMSSQRALQWGQLIGISPETVMMMKTNSRELESMFQKAHARALSPQETAAARRFVQQWDDLKDRMERFGQHLGITLLPVIEKIIRKVVSWWEANQKIIRSGIEKFIDVVANALSRFGAVVDKVKDALPWIAKFVTLLLDPQILGGGIFVALMGIATVLGLIAAKYVLIGAAVLSVAAAMEDLASSFTVEDGKVWGSGKDTLLNRALNGIRGGIYGNEYRPEEWVAPSKRGTPQGKGGAARLLDQMTDLLGNIGSANINTTAPSLIKTDPELLDAIKRMGDSAGKSEFNQTNNVTVTAPDAMSAGSEVVHRLKRLKSTDFATQGAAYPAN